MNILIQSYLSSLPDARRADMEALHTRILQMMPGSRVWFLDGKDETGKIVSNPQIGYGTQTRKYADGKTKELYQIGISANSTGISVYIMGLEDKTYLPDTYSQILGKATVTGYCIKFRKLDDIHLPILEAAIRDGLK